jgi:hypothetical protein
MPALWRAYEQRALAAVGKLVRAETVEELARGLAALHRPVMVDWAARFGLPPASATQSTCGSCGRVVSAGVATYCRDHPRWFGGGVFCMPCQRTVGAPGTPTSTAAAGAA